MVIDATLEVWIEATGVPLPDNLDVSMREDYILKAIVFFRKHNGWSVESKNGLRQLGDKV